MRIYSADNEWYSDDGGTHWARMTPTVRGHREVTEKLDDIKRAVTSGKPAAVNESAQALLQRLIDQGTRRR